MDWQSLITSFIGASAGTGIVGALIKSRFDGLVQERIEKVRSTMMRESTEHQIRFAHLHNKRAEVLAGTYSQLVVLHRAAARLISPFEVAEMGSKAERFTKVQSAFNDLSEYFFSNAIYLPEATAKKAESFIALIRDSVIDFNVDIMPELREPGYEKKWNELSKTINKSGKLLLDDIGNEFRSLLDHPKS